MYKNVIFDLGGVMVDFSPKDFLLERFCNSSTEDKVYRLTFGSETWKKLDAGLCSRYEGNQAMLAAAGDLPTPEALSSLKLPGWLKQDGLRIFCLKTYLMHFNT